MEFTKDVRLVPIPPEIKVSCGLGIKIAFDRFTDIKNTVLEEDIYIVEKQGEKRTAQKWENT